MPKSRTSTDVLFFVYIRGNSMGFRVVMIESDVRLSIKLDNLIVKKEEKETWIPIDDISMLVVDNFKFAEISF